MGKRGPPRTPTKTLKMRGSWLAATRTDEPTPPDGKPVQPAWLTPGGKRCWKHIVPMLDAMGLLAGTDQNALARYCDCWDRWRKTQKFLVEKGDFYTRRREDGNIDIIKFPQVTIYKQLMQDLLRLEQEFGLTSASRAGMATKAPKTSKGKGRFFKQGAG